MKLKVGLIGFGVMGRNHHRILESLPGVELVGILDLKHTKPDKNLNFVRSIKSLIELKIDYCVVSVPTKSHLKVSLELAKNGIPCLIEKPLAINANDGRKIAANFRKKGVLGSVGYIERFNPLLIKARKLIESNVLGSIYQISTIRHSPNPSRITDVGVVRDLATHDFDLTQWLLSSKYKWLKPITAKVLGSKFEDIFVAVGKLKNDVVTNHSVNWVSPTKERKVIILGERGSFVCDLTNNVLTHFKVSGDKKSFLDSKKNYLNQNLRGEMREISFVKSEPLYNEHLEFRNAVCGKFSSIVTLDEGVENLRLLDKILSPTRN